RDRIYGKAEWRGKTLEVVDTGGIIPDEKALIPQEILRQAQVAIKEAALLVLVVDSQAGLTPLDEELARLMRTTGKPFVLAVNKVDSPSQEANAAPFHSLGVPVFPLTAEHGTRFADTAGTRRKGKTKVVAEKLSVVMARRGLERSDVALLVIDGEQGVTQGDATIAGYAEQSGRSIILVVNKWDLALAAAREAALSDAATAKGKSRQSLSENRDPANIDPGKLMSDYENMIRAKLKFLSYAPIVFLSAKTGHRAEKLLPLINQCADARRRRIPTPALNDWLRQEVDLQRGSTPKSRPVRIYYVTQAKTAPPTFLLFTNQKTPLHFSYARFLENQLRAKFDFTGTPVRFVQRLRKREKRARTSSRDDQ